MLINSPIKYNGKKYDLLEQLFEFFPEQCETFYDLFGGSGVVSLNCNYNNICYNDINSNISDLFDYLCSTDYQTIVNEIKDIEKNFDIKSKSGFIELRKSYNDNKTPIKLLMLSYLSFNNGLRFNKQNDFNMTYGERTYGEKDLKVISEFKRGIKDKHIYI